MYKSKRAQVTIFIILAMLVVAGIVSFFIIQNSGHIDDESFSGNMSSLYVSDSIQSCLKDTSLAAIEFYGLKEADIKSYVESEVVFCVDDKLKRYIDSGSINSRLNNVSVMINDKIVLVNINYPIYMNSDDSSVFVSNFDVGFDLFSSKKLSIDSSCVVEYDADLFSFDNKFNIHVPRGTIAKNKNGSCVDEINLKIYDSSFYYGNSAFGLTSLVYIPGPMGTEFDSPVELKLYYSDLAYDRYITSSSNSNKLLETEEKLSLGYFDRETKEYYLYPNEEGLNSSVDTDENYIFTETKIFYDGNIPVESGCALGQGVVVESENKRVNLIIPRGTIAKNKDGSCVEKIDISIEPRRSNVVTFGDSEYVMLPSGATFEDSITYIYKYSQTEISDPRFLYGSHNWQDLITRNWSMPNLSYTSSGEIISSVEVRDPSDLKIAYYDEGDGVYRPWDTEVDKENNLIKAKINHFSANIPAQGCEDIRYFKSEDVLVVPLDSDGNCSGQKVGPQTISFTPIVGESCAKKNEYVVGARIDNTPGDDGDIKYLQDAGDVTVELEDADKTAEDGDTCANLDVVVQIKGIGLMVDGADNWIVADSHDGGGPWKWLDYNNKTSVIYGLGAGMCDVSLEEGCIEKDLCNRCWKDMSHEGKPCVAGQDVGWDCSKARLDGCVKDNCNGGEELGESGSMPVPSNAVISGNSISTQEYSIKQIAKLPNYLWFMANVGERLYSGVYSSPQYFYYSDSPFTTWNPVQIGSGDESTRVYNLNNRFYATSEGGNKGGGGKVYADSSVCYDFPSGTSYVLGAEYHDNKYLISRNKGDKTDIYSCPCSGGQTCSLWKSVDGIFTFHMTSYKGDLYLIGTSTKSYRTGDGGKVKIIRANGNVETLISSGPGSGVRAEVFDGKIFLGFSYDAEVWSYDGANKKSEISFPGMDHFGDFEVFDDKLFTVVVNEGGNPEVWYRKNDSSGGNWVKVFSGSQLGGYGVSGNLVNAAGFFTKYGDKLYMNINSPGGGRGGPGYILEIMKVNKTSATNTIDGSSLSSCSNFPGASWQTASASSMGLDESKLVELKNSVGGRGAVYYKGAKVYSWGDTSAKGDIASASKPIMSLILFYSIANGKIPGFDTKLSNYVGSCAGDITFFHVANMISGYALGESPGAKWAYNDRGIALYGKVLFEKVWRNSAQNVFNSVFSKLGFQNSPTMNTGAKSGRLTISTDDLARIGLFVSCKGNWNGNQIIPTSFFDNIKNQVSSSLPVSTKSSDCDDDPCDIGTFGGGCNQDRGGGGLGRYGFNFWVYNEEYNQGQEIPSDTLILDGHGGKEVMVIIPSKDILAVGFSSGGGWKASSDDSSTGFRRNVKLLVDAVPADSA